MTTVSSKPWRPGFAKRADNFPAVCAAAQTWRWRPGETVGRVAAAVLKGTPQLSMAQRMTLLLYVEHLNQERLMQNIACAWPSAGLVAQYLRCSESQARAHRKALEAAGYLLRDYTRANRPAGTEAYDLRPLMARLSELEGVAEAVRQEVWARRRAYHEAVGLVDSSAQAPKSQPLEQAQGTLRSSVREGGRRAARDPLGRWPSLRSAGQGEARLNGQGSAGSAVAEGAAYAAMVRQELQAAVQVCPRLAPLIAERILASPASATSQDAAQVAAAAARLLPHPQRGNDQTALRGWGRHAIRVVTMMAIALEDPEVRDPGRYFGKLISQARGTSDFRPNLARILHRRGKGAADAAPALEPAPGDQGASWPLIDARLARLLKGGAHESWFNQVHFHGLREGLLSISTPRRIAADRIRRDYLDAIRLAAAEAGVGVEAVDVWARNR